MRRLDSRPRACYNLAIGSEGEQPLLNTCIRKRKTVMGWKPFEGQGGHSLRSCGAE